MTYEIEEYLEVVSDRIRESKQNTRRYPDNSGFHGELYGWQAVEFCIISSKDRQELFESLVKTCEQAESRKQHNMMFFSRKAMTIELAIIEMGLKD